MKDIFLVCTTACSLVMVLICFALLARFNVQINKLSHELVQMETNRTQIVKNLIQMENRMNDKIFATVYEPRAIILED